MNVSANPTLSSNKWLPLPFLFPLAVSVCPTSVRHPSSTVPMLLLRLIHPSLPLSLHFALPSQLLSIDLSLTPSLLVIPTSATDHHPTPPSNILISISAPPSLLSSLSSTSSLTPLPSSSPAWLLGCCQHHGGVVFFFFPGISAHHAASSPPSLQFILGCCDKPAAGIRLVWDVAKHDWVLSSKRQELKASRLYRAAEGKMTGVHQGPLTSTPWHLEIYSTILFWSVNRKDASMFSLSKEKMGLKQKK